MFLWATFITAVSWPGLGILFTMLGDCEVTRTGPRGEDEAGGRWVLGVLDTDSVSLGG